MELHYPDPYVAEEVFDVLFTIELETYVKGVLATGIEFNSIEDRDTFIDYVENAFVAVHLIKRMITGEAYLYEILDGQVYIRLQDEYTT